MTLSSRSESPRAFGAVTPGPHSLAQHQAAQAAADSTFARPARRRPLPDEPHPLATVSSTPTIPETKPLFWQQSPRKSSSNDTLTPSRLATRKPVPPESSTTASPWALDEEVRRSPVPSDTTSSHSRRLRGLLRTLKETFLPASLLDIDRGPQEPDSRFYPHAPVRQDTLAALSSTHQTPAMVSRTSLASERSRSTERQMGELKPLRERRSLKTLRLNSTLRGAPKPAAVDHQVQSPRSLQHPMGIRQRSSSLSSAAERKRSPRWDESLPPPPPLPASFVAEAARNSTSSQRSDDDRTPKAAHFNFPMPPARTGSPSVRQPLPRNAPPTPPPTRPLPPLPLAETSSDEEHKRLSNQTSRASDPPSVSTMERHSASSATTPSQMESPPGLQARRVRSSDLLRDPQLAAQQVADTLERLERLEQWVGPPTATDPRLMGMGEGRELYVTGRADKIWRDGTSLNELLLRIRPLIVQPHPSQKMGPLRLNMREADLDWLIEYVAWGQAGGYEHDNTDTAKTTSRKKLAQLKRLRIMAHQCGNALLGAQELIHEELRSEIERIYEKSFERGRHIGEVRAIAQPLRDKISQSLLTFALCREDQMQQEMLGIEHNFELAAQGYASQERMRLAEELRAQRTRKIPLLDFRGSLAYLPNSINTWLERAHVATEAIADWLDAADICLQQSWVFLHHDSETLRLRMELGFATPNPRRAAKSLIPLSRLRRAEAQRAEMAVRFTEEVSTASR